MILHLFTYKKMNNEVNYKKLVKEAMNKNLGYFQSLLDVCNEYYIYEILEKRFGKDKYKEQKLIKKLKVMIPILNKNLDYNLNAENYDDIACGIIEEIMRLREKKRKWWMM